MDDAEFLAELERFDRTSSLRQVDPQAFRARVRTRTASLASPALAPVDGEIDRTGEEASGPDHAAYDELEREAPEPRSRPHVALAIAGFLLLMALGASAAALVFHDRVVQLFR